jgi:hypothetical protein
MGNGGVGRVHPDGVGSGVPSSKINSNKKVISSISINLAFLIPLNYYRGLGVSLKKYREAVPCHASINPLELSWMLPSL